MKKKYAFYFGLLLLCILPIQVWSKDGVSDSRGYTELITNSNCESSDVSNITSHDRFNREEVWGPARIVSVLAATSYAQQPGDKVDIIGRIGYCWGEEESFTNEDGVITYNSESWKGLAAWIGGEDWSDYTKVVFEFAETIPVATQIQLQTEAGNWTSWGNSGITSIQLVFENLDVTKVNQLVLQAADPATIVITAVYLVVGENKHIYPAAVDYSDYTELITNGDCNGDEVSNFTSKDWLNGEEVRGPARIVADPTDSNNKCIEVVSRDSEGATIDNWDTQFFITVPEKLNVGDRYRVTFRVRADKPASAQTQAHNIPGDYNYWEMLGDIPFTEEWVEIERTGTITENQVPANKELHAIAFNLAVLKEANNYYFDDISLLVLKSNEQSLLLSRNLSFIYSDGPFILPATTEEGLNVAWTSSNNNVATVSGNKLTIVGIGTATITAAQAGNDNYNPFTQDFTLNVAKAPLTITAKNYTINQGDAPPTTFEAEYSGFKNGETASVLTTPPSFLCSATSSSEPGTYDITPFGAEADNYEFAYVNGTLKIMGFQNINLTEIPDMTYGDDAFTLPETTTEGLNIVWTSSNNNVATISGNTLTIKGAGTATITAAQAGNDSYNPFMQGFSLNVAKAPLTITAKSYTIYNCYELPSFEAEYSGFVNGDDSSVLTTQPTFLCSATSTRESGFYTITVSGAEANNYDISYVNGILTITEIAPYALLDNGTLTFIYDKQLSVHMDNGENIFFLGDSYPRWYASGANRSVTHVVFDESFGIARPKTTQNWFSEMPLETIEGLEYLNTSEVTNMNSMFYDCGIHELDLSNFDFSKVENSDYLCGYCNQLMDLSLPSSISNVSPSAFEGVGSSDDPCHLIVPDGIDFGGVDTTVNVFEWKGGFFYLGDSFFASYVVFNDGTLTFYCDDNRDSREGSKYRLNKFWQHPDWCEKGDVVTKVVFDASFADARPETTYRWFSGMNLLTEIEGMEYLNTSNVFSGEDELGELGGMAYMFSGCSSLTSLDLSNYDTSNVKSMSGMFSGCSSLTSLDLSNFDTSNVKSMSGMFSGCSSLTSLDLSSFTLNLYESNENDDDAPLAPLRLPIKRIKYYFALTDGMFSYCNHLRTLTLPFSFEHLSWNACEGVGTENYPCQLIVPEDFCFNDINGCKIDTSAPSFQWKMGWYTLESAVLMGDANNDGIVTVTDVAWTVSYVLGENLPISIQAVDVNGDGDITISDITGIIDMILHSAPASMPSNHSAHRTNCRKVVVK